MDRWRVALIVSAAIAISYLDRQSLPVAVAAIERDIPLTNTQFGALTSIFLLAYAVMYLGGGALTDRLGSRRAFLLIMVVWSIACASHSLAATFGMLAASRLLLGMGEGGGFPAATKVVAERFPLTERSTAMGMVNAGTAVGGVVASPVIAAILSVGSWRWVFLACAAAGLVWVLVWLRVPQPPAGEITLEQSQNSAAEVEAGRWSRLLQYREVWGLVLAKFLTDAAWFFYISWLPKYLYDARGFDVKQVGYYAWLPFAASGIGAVVGGWLSGRLIAGGSTVNSARKITLGLSAALMPGIIFVTHVPVEWAIALFSLAFFGQQWWSTIVMVLPTDLFPRRVVATVAGLVGFGGAMGGLVMNLTAGRLLDLGFGYPIVFAIVGSLHLVGFAVILATVPRIGPLASRGDKEWA